MSRLSALLNDAGSDWQQFRISLASPEAEQRFAEEVQHAQSIDKNALKYPSLYVCHYSLVIVKAPRLFSICRRSMDPLSTTGTRYTLALPLDPRTVSQLRPRFTLLDPTPRVMVPDRRARPLGG